jgi:hypothetical protein
MTNLQSDRRLAGIHASIALAQRIRDNAKMLQKVNQACNEDSDDDEHIANHPFHPRHIPSPGMSKAFHSPFFTILIYMFSVRYRQ